MAEYNIFNTILDNINREITATVYPDGNVIYIRNTPINSNITEIRFNDYIGSNFIYISKWFNVVALLDTYGSAQYETDSSKFTILAHYYDINKHSRHKYRAITLFILYNDGMAEIGDIYYDINDNSFKFEYYNIFRMPPELDKISVETYAGRSSFLYYPTLNEITLYIDSYTLSKIPKHLRNDDYRMKIDINKNYMRSIKLNNLNFFINFFR